MKALLALTAAAEAATGLLILVDPALAVSLLFGTEVAGPGLMVGRFAGMALLGLAIACWPSGSARPPQIGMLVYGVGVTLMLLTVGVLGGGGGVLLWPALAVHGLIAAGLMISLRRGSGHA